MRDTPSGIRATVLIAGAGLGVHELRYLLAPAANDHAAGHAYLPFVGVAVTLALALVGAHLMALASGATGPSPGARRARPQRDTGEHRFARSSFCASWIASTLALVVIFAGQELLEGLLSGPATHHLDVLLADGGWIVLPLGVVAGAVVASSLAGAQAVISVAGHRRHQGLRGRSPRIDLGLPREQRPASCVLARHLAGRAPPLTS